MSKNCLSLTCSKRVGQRVTDEFEKLNHEINEFDWYLFPPQIQRLLPIIMIWTQQEVEFECFGSILCTRETFKKVSYASERAKCTISICVFSGYQSWELLFHGHAAIYVVILYQNHFVMSRRKHIRKVSTKICIKCVFVPTVLNEFSPVS